tara:strand:- start:3137 stop:3496 length:360 start_codon:yes stop_codon:yes gene_type:complete
MNLNTIQIKIITGAVLILILALVWMFMPSLLSKSEPPKSEPPKSEPPKSEPPKSEPPKEKPWDGKCVSKTNLLDADGKKTRGQIEWDKRCGKLQSSKDNICESALEYPNGSGSRCRWVQ